MIKFISSIIDLEGNCFTMTKNARKDQFMHLFSVYDCNFEPIQSP